MARTFSHHFPDSVTQCWGLPEQTHYSVIIRHRSLALLLRMHFIDILYFRITQFTLYTALTSDITQFPDYMAMSRHDDTTLYITSKTRLLLSRVRVRLNNPPCHRRRPPPVRRQSPTTTTRGLVSCYVTPDHCLWPVPCLIHNLQP